MVPFAAVGGVEVVPAVAIEVGHGDRGPHRGDLGHDVVELGVELRRRGAEIDARGLGNFFQVETIAGEDAGAVDSPLSHPLMARSWPSEVVEPG